jgi:antitoxin VapB
MTSAGGRWSGKIQKDQNASFVGAIDIYFHGRVYTKIAMTILIKDREADQLIRTLAERTGESITDAVKQAVRERLERVPLTEDEVAARARKIDALVAKANALPTVDNRTADEIIGYNERGHFD